MLSPIMRLERLELRVTELELELARTQAVLEAIKEAVAAIEAGDPGVLKSLHDVLQDFYAADAKPKRLHS
jgi:hypothetical protein